MTFQGLGRGLGLTQDQGPLTVNWIINPPGAPQDVTIKQEVATEMVNQDQTRQDPGSDPEVIGTKNVTM